MQEARGEGCDQAYAAKVKADKAAEDKRRAGRKVHIKTGIKGGTPGIDSIISKNTAAGQLVIVEPPSPMLPMLSCSADFDAWESGLPQLSPAVSLARHFAAGSAASGAASSGAAGAASGASGAVSGTPAEAFMAGVQAGVNILGRNLQSSLLSAAHQGAESGSQAEGDRLISAINSHTSAEAAGINSHTSAEAAGIHSHVSTAAKSVLEAVEEGNETAAQTLDRVNAAESARLKAHKAEKKRRRAQEDADDDEKEAILAAQPQREQALIAATAAATVELMQSTGQQPALERSVLGVLPAAASPVAHASPRPFVSPLHEVVAQENVAQQQVAAAASSPISVAKIPGGAGHVQRVAKARNVRNGK